MRMFWCVVNFLPLMPSLNFTEEKIRQELAEKGRERMEKFFDWKIAASAYIDVFKKII